MVSSRFDVAIIRTGVSGVYLEVLGWHGQRSVGVSIGFYSVCSRGRGQSEDTGLYGSLDCSSVGILLILARLCTVTDGENQQL